MDNVLEKLTQNFAEKDEAKKVMENAAAYQKQFENDVLARQIALDREKYEQRVEAEAMKRLKG